MMVGLMEIKPCRKEDFAYLHGNVAMMFPEKDFFSKEEQQELIDTFPGARIEYVKNGHLGKRMSRYKEKIFVFPLFISVFGRSGTASCIAFHKTIYLVGHCFGAVLAKMECDPIGGLTDFPNQQRGAQIGRGCLIVFCFGHSISPLKIHVLLLLRLLPAGGIFRLFFRLV
jgi:hypothetical protein